MSHPTETEDRGRAATVRAALIVAAAFLVISGNWPAALIGAIFVQLGRIAAMLIERRRCVSGSVRVPGADPSPRA